MYPDDDWGDDFFPEVQPARRPQPKRQPVYDDFDDYYIEQPARKPRSQSAWGIKRDGVHIPFPWADDRKSRQKTGREPSMADTIGMLFFFAVLIMWAFSSGCSVRVDTASLARIAECSVAEARLDFWNSIAIIIGTASVLLLAFCGIMALMIMSDKIRRDRELKHLQIAREFHRRGVYYENFGTAQRVQDGLLSELGDCRSLESRFRT
jgi:hypothetical protein